MKKMNAAIAVLVAMTLALTGMMGFALAEDVHAGADTEVFTLWNTDAPALKTLVE